MSLFDPSRLTLYESSSCSILFIFYVVMFAIKACDNVSCIFNANSPIFWLVRSNPERSNQSSCIVPWVFHSAMIVVWSLKNHGRDDPVWKEKLGLFLLGTSRGNFWRSSRHLFYSSTWSNLSIKSAASNTIGFLLWAFLSTNAFYLQFCSRRDVTWNLVTQKLSYAASAS